MTVTSARTRRRRVRAVALPGGAIAFLIAGLVFGDAAWMTGLVVTGVPTVWRTLRSAFAGRFATDVVALLAIIAAVLLSQPFAGLIIVLMQSGGEALETFAEGRASSALRALEDAAPGIAHRTGQEGRVDDVEVNDIAVGDVLLVRPGELVPCDAIVVGGASRIDASRLTGEPMPFRAVAGVELLSGSVNLEGSLTVRATAIAAESQYARIVELVRSARSSRAPLQRLADRYAVWFTPVVLGICGVTFVATHDWTRVLAILVVATPCPLIIATPVAIIGGISRAARRQIIVRTGAALEQLAGVTVAVFDKTGTLTIGRPVVDRVRAFNDFSGDDVMRLAASVELGSSHQLARTIVERAEEAGPLSPASDVIESFGSGVTGTAEGHTVAVGGRRYVEHHLSPSRLLPDDEAQLRAFVSIDGRHAGTIDFADRVRSGLPLVFTQLNALGIARSMLLSGDDAKHTRAVADAIGIREAHGDLLPGDKVRIVKELVEGGGRVMMVGDGTNDAPALEHADVGIALAAHGGGIAAEAADVVVLTDDISRVVDAMQISRRTIRIARQSIQAGLLASAVAMVGASAGLIQPVSGALIQEVIDVAVILNALRTSRAGS